MCFLFIIIAFKKKKKKKKKKNTIKSDLENRYKINRLRPYTTTAVHYLQPHDSGVLKISVTSILSQCRY
jgi:hypothetical protein